MQAENVRSDLEARIRAGDLAGLRTVAERLATPDLAELIGSLPDDEMAVAFRVLHHDRAATVFEYLAPDRQESLLRAFGDAQATQILERMSPDDRTRLLEELPGEVTRRVMKILPPGELRVAKSLLAYPEGSVARRMTPDYIAVREQLTVGEVLDHIREHGEESETLSVFYVVDRQGKLVDEIRARQLLLSPVATKLPEIMNRRAVSLRTTETEEAAALAFQKYDRVALPVVDPEGVLVGIVTVDDFFDVAERLSTETIHRMGGQEALDLPYLATSLREMVRKRAGWLLVLFVGEMLTATAMGFFENEIRRAVVLALFVPLIISSGGNSGSQAASLLVRAMALGEVRIRDWWKVTRREVVTGVCLGAILGLVGFLRISVWTVFTALYGPHWLLIALTIWAALIGVVAWGTLAGATLPLVMKRLGADPATSSAPFVATLVDVTGLVIYFSIAAVILRGALL